MGALGCSISGSGPSIFALTKGRMMQIKSILKLIKYTKKQILTFRPMYPKSVQKE